VLCRHALNTRAKRLGLVAGYAAPFEPPRDPGPERHVDVSRPGELVGIDCFFVGRLQGTKGSIWQLTAISPIEVALLLRLGGAGECKEGTPALPSAKQTSRFARRVAKELREAGWRLERLLSDNGNEFKGDFTKTVGRLQARHTRIRAGRPQTNGNSRRFTARSSTSAGGLPSPATCTPAFPA